MRCKLEKMKSNQISSTTLLNSILFVSFNTLTILMFLSARSKDLRSLVIFNALSYPSFAFDAFVLSITFSFSTALGALLIPNKPILAIYYAFYSVAFMAFALFLLILGLYYFI
ncbi:hypothetical protein Csa_004664 [Cucumis sativus]|uniref:PGG domain-containing protein n=1 Tax=Cucumis sativus TaxID=3659 RepID=A0A0A0KN11_CUCSA|nr:hypothetical protein Csa_004664 [Cucumis sativus]